MSKPTLRALSLCVALVAGAASAVPAQDAGAEVYRLSLAEALEMALQNNLDLVSARYAPEVARESIQLEKAQFDVGLESSWRHSEQQQAATQQSTVTGSESDTFEAGIAHNLDFGASYTFGFQSNLFEQTGPLVLAPSSYFSGFALTFNLPLLKGLGKEVTTERLVLARNDLDISLADLEGRAERTLETVEGAYWDVLAGREALRIAHLRLERSRDLLELNRKKVEVGTLAPIEITQAEAEVAANQEGVIVAETQLLDAEDELRRLLAIPPDNPMWGVSIEPTDRPLYETREIDVDAAIETALESRSEMFTARQTLRNRELSERVARQNVRHQLDFDASYIPQGSSLDLPNPVPPPELLETAQYSDSVSNIFDGEEYDWSATLTYRIPFGNRAAKASYATARLNREQSQVDLRNQAQTIRVEIRTAVRAVESGIKRIEAARANVLLQRKKLEAEQKKFENGMSTSFEVLTFQNDLADAELSEIRARLDYVKALAALERSKGTLLEMRNLRLE